MSEEKTDLMKQKLDPLLIDIVNSSDATLPVIVQTVDGLKDEDKELLEKLDGKLKDDLYIINAFSAELSTEAIKTLVEKPRVTKIFFDAEVRAV